MMQNRRFVPLLLLVGLVLPASNSLGNARETAIAADNPPQLTFVVTGCNAHERFTLPETWQKTSPKQSSPRVENRKDRNLQVVVKDQTLAFSHPLQYVCCAQLQLDHQIKNNVITVTETNVGKVCRCMCTYSVSATLGKLAKGTYDLQIYGVKFVAKPGDIGNKPALLFHRQVDVK